MHAAKISVLFRKYCIFFFLYCGKHDAYFYITNLLKKTIFTYEKLQCILIYIKSKHLVN